MAEGDGTSSVLPAGDFSSWLSSIRIALETGGEIEVACGDCIGCCTSSYFIEVGPDEVSVREAVDNRLLFPAPGRPSYSILGYDKKGRCPMIRDGTCSIYSQRPKICRTYDCRIFSAAGILAGNNGKKTINERVRRWQFSYADKRGLLEHEAVKTAASYIRNYSSFFPGGRAPVNASDVASAAIKVYGIFIDEVNASLINISHSSHIELASAVVSAYRDFEGSQTTAETTPRGAECEAQKSKWQLR
jgi:uncharacterized protein